MSVFKFSGYKDYLNATISQGVFAQRGGKTRLAKAANCQLAFVSQVLSGPAHFSLEQADGISHLLQHGPQEREYFLMLLQHDRAGTPSLQTFFRERLARIRESANRLSERIDSKIKDGLTTEQKAEYYSSWQYAAVHVAVGIPSLNSPQALAHHFSIPKRRLAQILQFLLRADLIAEGNGSYQRRSSRLHLTAGSAQFQQMTVNWRLKAAEVAEARDESALQYSSVVTLSRKDAVQLKEELMNSILRAKRLIKDSGDEEVFCLNADFFRLGGES